MFINVEQRGDDLLVREYGADWIDNSFQPQLHYLTQRDSQLKTMVGDHNLDTITFENIREFQGALRKHDDRGDDVFGSKNAIVQYVNTHYNGTQEVDLSKYKIFNIDIEVEVTKGEFPTPAKCAEVVNAITIIFEGNTYVWGLTYEGATKFVPDDGILYMEFTKEIDLLESLVKFWEFHNPHIITGWNVEAFDVPYIHNRIQKILGKDDTKRLSPWKWVTTSTGFDQFGNPREVINIKGVNTMDYLLLYRKYEFAPRENYKLNTISHVELGEKKIDYSEHGTLMELYRNDYAKFMRYNIKDTELVERLEEKKKLLELAITVAAYGKVNLDRIFMTIPIWESIIYNRLADRNIMPKIKTDMGGQKSRPYMGAFVKDVMTGIHKWLASIDLASLYPNTIRQWNIGSETLVDPRDVPEELQYLLADIHVDSLLLKEHDLSLLKKHDMTMTANGYFFTTTKKSHFSQLMEDLFMQRKEEKRQMKHYKNELLKVRQEIDVRSTQN